MTVADLIADLKNYPPDSPVLIADWKRHEKMISDGDPDGSSDGLYSEFEIIPMNSDTEHEGLRRENPDSKLIPFVAIAFSTTDDDDEEDRPEVVTEVDFSRLEDVAQKHNITAREVYDILTDVQSISRTSVRSGEEVSGYKGDKYSQTE